MMEKFRPVLALGAILFASSTVQAGPIAQRLRDRVAEVQPLAHWKTMPKGVGNGNIGAKVGRLAGFVGVGVAGYYGGPIASAVASRILPEIGERVGKRVGQRVYSRIQKRRG